ncbi:MAG: bud emergence protein 1 [Phylliscum demangeonii]|nr:MAG: bud emergence protein 1 [Phylliscum demangeonii]
MKALRRSLKGDKTDVRLHPHHTSLSPKDATAILPPKKVIRALYDYDAHPDHEQELTFSKGDFFHVIGRENDPDWYEACNPSMPNARGLVPVRFFQILGRTERDSSGSNLSRMSDSRGSGDSNRFTGSTMSDSFHPPTSNPNAGKGSGAMVYGIVMYDFAAERPDELEAKAGEAIIVIAQSNPEWFVAKPIGRLGGPGLIPVSFIEIRDMTTQQPVPDAQQAVQRAGVPKVEEWKKMAADYKNSSISLGRFETGGVPRVTQEMERMSVSNGRHSYQNGQANGHPPSSYPNPPSGAMMPPAHPSTNPYSRPASSQLLAPVSATISRWCFARDKYWYVIEAVMEDGRRWELSRFYQDFYDFQIALLKEFPEEAGNAGRPRTLPFMPGPVTYVTDQISNGRRQSLDEYIKRLLSMPPYIARHVLLRQLFAPREGDVPMEADPTTAERLSYGRLSGDSQPSSSESPDGASRQSSRGNLNGTNGTNGYTPGLSAPPPARPGHRRGPPSMSNGVPTMGGAAGGSGHQRTGSDALSAPPPHPGISRQISSLTQTSNGSQATTTAAGGNHSGAMKIKIYYQDDLIAIRVPAEISFEQLKEKVQTRLSVGGAIRIRYKDETHNSLERLASDADLDVALQRNPKLTLYVN